MACYVIIGSVLSCVLACASIAWVSTLGGDKILTSRSYKSSIHLQIDEKSGDFIHIFELLKNRNKLLYDVIRKAEHTKYLRM
jgi:hypothetical protein